MKFAQPFEPLARVRFSRLVNGSPPLSEADRSWLLSEMGRLGRKDLLRVLNAYGPLDHAPEFVDALVIRITASLGDDSDAFSFFMLEAGLKPFLTEDMFAVVWAKLNVPLSVRLAPLRGPAAPAAASGSPPKAATAHGDPGISCDCNVRIARNAASSEELKVVARCLAHHPRHGAEYLKILREYFERGDAINTVVPLLGHALGESEWKSIGAELVARVVVRHDPRALAWLFWGEDLGLDRGRSCELAIHRGFAEGLLLAVARAIGRGDIATATRSLTAIGHLDLAPHLTRKLHGIRNLPAEMKPTRDAIDRIAKRDERLRSLHDALWEAIAALYTHEMIAEELDVAS